MKFLEKHAQHITGDVLEIQSTAYIQACGRNVRRSESLDIDPRHGTTYVGDLAHCEGLLASDAYDCFLLPNTLNHLKEIDACLRHALRVVKPGGVVLATAPVLTPLTPDFSEYQRFTVAGLQEIAHRVWPDCKIAVESYGNVLAATAALMGFAYEELSAQELDVNDGRYPVLLTLFCRKAR